MANTNQFPNIPAEKFQFAKGRDLQHDSKFSTKPVSYFQGAFRRFCKNKGAAVAAVIILCLVLFAVIAPFFTPFTPAYYDMTYSYVTPKISYFADNGIHFWDGGRERSVGYNTYIKDYALAQETGRDVIMDGEYTQSVDEEGVTIYSYRYDTYAGVGFGKYKIISEEEFLDIQRYQNETGRQVLYPIVKLSNKVLKNETGEGSTIVPIYCGDLNEAVTLFDRDVISLDISTTAGDLWAKDKTGLKVRDRFDVQPVDTAAVVLGKITIPTAG